MDAKYRESMVTLTNSKQMESSEEDRPEANGRATTENTVRAGWGNKIEFFMAMLGSCVGLGSVWRFPYLCYSNGGGAFLLAYILMVLLLGLPIFYLETTLGQFSNLSALSVWKLSPLFKGVGIGAFITAVLITTYYNALIAQFLYYFVLSLTGTLPWSRCFDWWGASACCSDSRLPSNTSTQCSASNFSVPCFNSTNLTSTAYCAKHRLPAEEFYNTYVLRMSEGIDKFGYPVWQIALSLLICWTIVTLVLLRGASSFGKAAYFTAIFPYVMLTVMLIKGATLEGALDGILYFIIPDWSRLLDPIVWSNAAGQVFFSLSTAYGQTIALASYNDFSHPLLRDGSIIVLMTMCTAILSGFVVFSILGYMANQKGVPLQDVVSAGPGLVFEVYPEALATMPISTLWAILFFLMMLTLGFGTQFSQVETIQVVVEDELSWILKGSKKRKAILRITVSCLMFLLGLPLTCEGGIYLLNLVDHSSGTFGLLFIALAECLIIPWVYGYDRFAEDIRIMSGRRPSRYFIVCWSIVLPVALTVVLIMNFVKYKEPSYENYQYPPWALSLGVAIMILPVIVIPIWSLFYFCVSVKSWVLLREAARPSLGWGPSRADNYKMYMSSLPSRHQNFQTRSTVAEAYAVAMRADKLRWSQTTDNCLNASYVVTESENEVHL